MGFFSGLTSLSNAVIGDLAATGVIGSGANPVGGHATTQVITQNPGGLSTQITTTHTGPQFALLIGATIAVIIGIFLLVEHNKPRGE